MSWWDGTKHDPIRPLRASLKLDRERLANAPLGARGRNNLKARIVWQEEELKELLWQKRLAEKQRKVQVNPMYM